MKKIVKDLKILEIAFPLHLAECYCRYEDSSVGESKMAACSYHLEAVYFQTGCLLKTVSVTL